MFSLKILYVICRKVPLALNFKILAVETSFFISISELLYPHKTICMPNPPPVSLDDAFLHFKYVVVFVSVRF